MSEYVVELKNITKRFPGVVALKNMSIGIRPGEIHGLIGENGAGKSTLIKVLTGVHTPEEGEIYVDGQKVVFHNPVQSREAGIACVYQELNIVKQLITFSWDAPSRKTAFWTTPECTRKPSRP